MRNGKAKYENIEIPKELDRMINQTIEKEQHERHKRNRQKQWIAVAAALVLFVTPLNVSQAFADTMAEIPVIGVLAKVLTFRSYQVENEDIVAEVTIPEVTELTSKAYEDQVNGLIQEKVDVMFENAKREAEEYKEAYLATGGTEEEYEARKVQAKVDYQVFSKTEDVLSFSVYSWVTVAAAYEDHAYYNLDLRNNRELTLVDLLGEDYVAVATDRVKGQMETQSEQEGVTFWEETMKPEWQIPEDISFYINESGNPVLVFEKYEIAAGAFGRLEYEIEKN